MRVPVAVRRCVAQARMACATSSGSTTRPSGVCAAFSPAPGGCGPHEARVHGGGRDAQKAHRAEGARHGHRQRVQRGLGGAIGHVAAQAREGGDRGHVDHGGILRGAQQRQQGPCHGIGAAHVGAQDAVEQSGLQRIDLRVRDALGEARAVDQQVHPAKVLLQPLGGGGVAGLVLQRQLQRVVAARQFLAQRLGAVAALVVADHDGGALAGQGPRRGGAYAAAGAGDDGDSVLQWRMGELHHSEIRGARPCRALAGPWLIGHSDCFQIARRRHSVVR